MGASEGSRPTTTQDLSHTPLRTALMALPVAALTALMLAGGGLPRDLPGMLALAITYVFFNAMFVLMLHTGKTDRWRGIKDIDRRWADLPFAVPLLVVIWSAAIRVRLDNPR